METHRALAARIFRWVIAGAAISLLTAGSTAQSTTDSFTRDHGHGETTLRFHRDRFHYALILDGRLRGNTGRELVTAAGRRIPVDWSGRSIWIDGAKFELPFGAVFLLSTKDSTRARQIEFNAMRGRLVMDQAAAAPEAAEWISQHGAPEDTVTRGAVQAATYPRHTLELTEWSYHGVNAVTCIVSGDPLFILFSEAPLHGGSSTQTTFGNLAAVDVQVGSVDEQRAWHATPTQATFAYRTYDFSRGRVFLIPGNGGEVRQVQAALDLGPGSANRIADEIERMPDVRTFLRLE
jgi:hypothetical protein